MGKEVDAILCSALNRIRNHCLRKLTRCFNPGDVGRMVEGQVDDMRANIVIVIVFAVGIVIVQVDEMRTYLTRLSGNRLGSEQLDNCDIDIRQEEEQGEEKEENEKRGELYGQDSIHHFKFYDVADREVGTHTFNFEPMGETISNGTLVEVIDIREEDDMEVAVDTGEDLQDWSWGDAEMRKVTKKKTKKVIGQEVADIVYSKQSGSEGFNQSSVVLVLLLAACVLNAIK